MRKSNGAIFSVIFLSLLFLSCTREGKLEKVKVDNKLRVISAAPSITETIFALGAESTLVGVSNFCQYPPAAKKLTKIGGYFDPAYETILMLRPDIVFVVKEHKKLIDFLRDNKIKTVMISTNTFADICTSFVIIGRELNKKEKADSILLEIKKEINKFNIVERKKRSTILFCVGRDKIGTGTIGTIYCAGPKTFYSEIIELAGGSNCIKESSLEYPLLSAEKIIKLSPEIIIDISASNLDIDSETLKKDWLELSTVSAIKNNSLYILKGDYLSIPGPRILEIIKEIRRCIRESE
ncbi:MAG: helical backbone metal receptor [Chitinispirillaceae bacterium]|nr:helical backbone metal receptor [Chitinispirillaceae bacterium]